MVKMRNIFITQKKNGNETDGHAQVQPGATRPQPHGLAEALGATAERVGRDAELLASIVELVQILSSVDNLLHVDAHVAENLFHLALHAANLRVGAARAQLEHLVVALLVVVAKQKSFLKQRQRLR